MAITVCEAKLDACNLLVCQLESNEGNVKKKKKKLDEKSEDLPTLRETSSVPPVVVFPDNAAFTLKMESL